MAAVNSSGKSTGVWWAPTLNESAFRKYSHIKEEVVIEVEPNTDSILEV